MLEMIDIGIDNAVAFRISGKITENDMSVVLGDAKEKIERYQNIVLLERFDSFQGIEITALVEEFKYLYEVGISNISKAAVLTDKKWLAKIVHIEDKIFKSIDMRCFALEDQESAVNFLKT